jgi:PAS domain S-box-containing protein
MSQGWPAANFHRPQKPEISALRHGTEHNSAFLRAACAAAFPLLGGRYPGSNSYTCRCAERRRRSPEGSRIRFALREELARAARGVGPLPKPHTAALLTKSGELRWIRWHDAKGPGDLLIGAGQDIADLRRAEEELDRHQRDFHAIFEASSDGMLILNSDWIYVMVNPAACGIVGLPAEQIVGAPHGTLLKSQLDVLEIRKQALGASGTTGETEFHRPDGESRHVEYSIVPFFRADHHLIIMRDITDRRRLELQLAQAQRLEAIGRLAGGHMTQQHTDCHPGLRGTAAETVSGGDIP